MLDLAPQDAASTEASQRLSAAVPSLAALPNVVIVGYPVSGWSRRSIRDDINALRPDLNGEKHDAATTWQYRIRFRNGADGQCQPTTAEVTVEITVTMPDLLDPEHLDRDDTRAWQNYMAALEIHEGNHVRIVNHGAERMQSAMRAAPSCDAMRVAVQEFGEGITAASEEYDRRTRHGATEGFRF